MAMGNMNYSMQKIRCFQFCFLGLGLKADAFRAMAPLSRGGIQSYSYNSYLSQTKSFSRRPSSISSTTTWSKVGSSSCNQLQASIADVEDQMDPKNGTIPTQKRYNSTQSTEPNDNDSNSTNSGANDPVCRVVATSDGKISPIPAISSLDPSSKSLLEKIELLYTVQSQKELRDLAYMMPRSAAAAAAAAANKKEVFHDKLSTDAMENTEGGINGNPPLSSSVGQEERLVSILKQSLEDGGFKLMDQRDLDLCSALNAGYLLRLSLQPDIKDLDPCIGQEFYPELYNDEETDEENGSRSSGGRKDGKKKVGKDPTIPSSDKLLFDGRVLIFRRGYSQEITTGRLLLPKLDYLQASLVQRSSIGITRKLGAIEQRLEDFVLSLISKINDAIQRSYQQLLQGGRNFTVNVLENFGLSKNELVASLVASKSNETSDEIVEDVSLSNKTVSASSTTYNVRGNRIFKLGRYQTQSTSTNFLNSFDLNDALSPFLLCEVVDSNDSMTDNVERDIYDGMDSGKIQCSYDDTLFTDATATLENNGQQRPSQQLSYKLLERTSIQNTVDFFSQKGRKELIRNYFKSSTLVEPAYEEVIVIWRPKRKKKPLTIQQVFPPKWLYNVAEIFDMEDRLPKRKNNTSNDDFDDGPMPLEIKAFNGVPMANIQAVLPKTRLIFRPADAIVFDLVSVISFLAVVGSVKFDSPKLDLIALVSLSFFAIRTFFRYSNKYARYDLLVNKFLTSKISHRGPGALKYIVSEAISNKALRALLVRDWLCKMAETKGIVDGQLNLDNVLGQGKSYVNDASASQIDVDILAALDDLSKLDLVNQYEVKSEKAAQDTLKQLWNDALD